MAGDIDSTSATIWRLHCDVLRIAIELYERDPPLEEWNFILFLGTVTRIGLDIEHLASLANFNGISRVKLDAWRQGRSVPEITVRKLMVSQIIKELKRMRAELMELIEYT